MKTFFCFVLTGLCTASLFGTTPKGTLVVGYIEARPFIYAEEGKLDGFNYRI